MTISANRIPNSKNIKVTMNYGPIMSECTEDYQHLKWTVENLTKLIAEIESE